VLDGDCTAVIRAKYTIPERTSRFALASSRFAPPFPEEAKRLRLRLEQIIFEIMANRAQQALAEDGIPDISQYQGDDWFLYDGVDPRLKGPYCNHCCKDWANAVVRIAPHLPKPPEKKLQKCASCRLVYYCCRDCQTADWKTHKQFCKRIKSMRLDIQKKEALIPTRLFKTQVGNFWELAFPYVKARFDLALSVYYTLASHSNCIDHWEEGCGQLQELLRLCHNHDGYDLGLKDKFPYILVDFGRDDDAYAYCRYWVKRMYGNRSSSDGELYDRLHENSKPGDWIYPREHNCRFKNFFDECTGVDPNDIGPLFLAAVWLIKRKLLCAMVSAEHAYACFLNTDSAQEGSIQQEHTIRVFEYLLGFDITGPTAFRDMVERQDAELNRISDIIDSKNRDVLPSFLAEPRQCDQLLYRYPPGPSGTEQYDRYVAWGISHNASKTLAVLPGLQKWIKRRYGANVRFPDTPRP